MLKLGGVGFVHCAAFALRPALVAATLGCSSLSHLSPIGRSKTSTGCQLFGPGRSIRWQMLILIVDGSLGSFIGPSNTINMKKRFCLFIDLHAEVRARHRGLVIKIRGLVIAVLFYSWILACLKRVAHRSFSHLEVLENVVVRATIFTNAWSDDLRAAVKLNTVWI